MSAIAAEYFIKPGARFEQTATNAEGKTNVRVIEIIAGPTPSMPASYRIVRNDAHPHRVGKTASIRRADLEAKYYPI